MTGAVTAATAGLWGGLGLAASTLAVRAGLLEPDLSWIGAGLATLGGLTLQGVAVRRRDRIRVQRAVQGLRDAQLRLCDDLELIREEMTGLTYSFESSARLRTQKLVSEMQVLEGLIERFHDDFDEARDAPAQAWEKGTGASAHSVADAGGALGAEGADGARLAAIRDALAGNRVELHLQPIVSLPQRRLRAYEVLTRLRDAHDALLMPQDYLDPARSSGLMSSIDNLLVFRTVQMARRLPPRQRSVALMCNISGTTLTDGTFFEQFLDFVSGHRDLAPQIVFEFSQADIDHAGPEEMARLARLSDMGFRLSMDQVSDLTIDPHYLNQRNIRFVKIPARLLLDPHTARRRDIDPADMPVLFKRQGVDLIAEKIEDERTVVEVLEYNAGLGQGFLFGEPRPLRFAEP